MNVGKLFATNIASHFIRERQYKWVKKSKSFLEKKNPIYITRKWNLSATNIFDTWFIQFSLRKKSHERCESWNTFHTNEFSCQRIQMSEDLWKGMTLVWSSNRLRIRLYLLRKISIVWWWCKRIFTYKQHYNRSFDLNVFILMYF